MPAMSGTQKLERHVNQEVGTNALIAGRAVVWHFMTHPTRQKNNAAE